MSFVVDRAKKFQLKLVIGVFFFTVSLAVLPTFFASVVLSKREAPSLRGNSQRDLKEMNSQFSRWQNGRVFFCFYFHGLRQAVDLGAFNRYPRGGWKIDGTNDVPPMRRSTWKLLGRVSFDYPKQTASSSLQLNIYSPLLISSLRKQKTKRKIGIENFFFRFEANFAMEIAQLIVNAVTFTVDSGSVEGLKSAISSRKFHFLDVFCSRTKLARWSRSRLNELLSRWNIVRESLVGVSWQRKRNQEKFLECFWGFRFVEHIRRIIVVNGWAWVSIKLVALSSCYQPSLP